MKQFSKPETVSATFHEFKTTAWAAMYNIALTSNIEKIDGEGLGVEHYNAAYAYKLIQSQDHGKSAPEDKLRSPRQTNITIGLHDEAELALQAFATSVAQRTQGGTMNEGHHAAFERLGQALLERAQSQVSMLAAAS